MAWITLLNAQLAFGHVALLDHADFALEARERVGLIGRNGAGKSSLLKILGGLMQPDDGTLQLQQGLRVAYVAQEPQLDAHDTIFSAVAAGLRDVIAARERYLAHEAGVDLDALQSFIEQHDGWNWEQRVQETLQRLQLEPEARIATLSGGMKNASRSRRRWSRGPTCCCSTSPPTTSTSPRSSGSKSCCSPSPAAWSRSRTTAPFWTASPRAS